MGVLIVAVQQASFSKIRAFLVGVGEGGGERPENKFQIKFKISMQICRSHVFPYLDGIIDEPLQCGESTDHDDPGSKTGPHSGESKIPSGRSNC